MSAAVPWSSILDLLAEERIHDLLVVAVRDSTLPDSVAVPTGEIYLELDYGFLRFDSVNNHGGLQARHLPALDLRSCRDESGLDALLVTLGHLFLGESQTVECLRVDYLTTKSQTWTRASCAAPSLLSRTVTVSSSIR